MVKPDVGGPAGGADMTGPGGEGPLRGGTEEEKVEGGPAKGTPTGGGTCEPGDTAPTELPKGGGADDLMGGTGADMMGGTGVENPWGVKGGCPVVLGWVSGLDRPGRTDTDRDFYKETDPNHQ